MSDTKQADVGNWDSDFPPDNKGGDGKKAGRIPFMKFDKPGNYTIRLIGNHVKFLQHWQPFTERVITHPDYKDEDPAWQAKFYPRVNFAIHIIDRADGKLKILSKGRSLFKQFASYKVVNDINPAGKDGPDWVITVEWPNGNKMQAKYGATAKAKPSPFTAEEIEMIKTNKVNLKDIYMATPLEKIQELWDELPDEAKIPPKRDDDGNVKEEKPSKRPEPIEESMPDAPAENNDDGLFGSEEDDTAF